MGLEFHDNYSTINKDSKESFKTLPYIPYSQLKNKINTWGQNIDLSRWMKNTNNDSNSKTHSATKKYESSIFKDQLYWSYRDVYKDNLAEIEVKSDIINSMPIHELLYLFVSVPEYYNNEDFRSTLSIANDRLTKEFQKDSLLINWELVELENEWFKVPVYFELYQEWDLQWLVRWILEKSPKIYIGKTRVGISLDQTNIISWLLQTAKEEDYANCYEDIDNVIQLYQVKIESFLDQYSETPEQKDNTIVFFDHILNDPAFDPTRPWLLDSYKKLYPHWDVQDVWNRSSEEIIELIECASKLPNNSQQIIVELWWHGDWLWNIWRMNWDEKVIIRTRDQIKYLSSMPWVKVSIASCFWESKLKNMQLIWWDILYSESSGQPSDSKSSEMFINGIQNLECDWDWDWIVSRADAKLYEILYHNSYLKPLIYKNNLGEQKRLVENISRGEKNENMQAENKFA